MLNKQKKMVNRELYLFFPHKIDLLKADIYLRILVNPSCMHSYYKMLPQHNL